MNLEKINTSLFNRLRFILVETSSAGNVGATARAIKTMGFSDLVLVNPRFPDVLCSQEAIALSSGAYDILSKARVVSNISQALEGCNFAAALSTRLRKFHLPLTTPRNWATQLARNTDLKAAVIFGSERYGLPNKIVEKCNIMVSIPASVKYSSLNLSQAVQILAYECQVAANNLDLKQVIEAKNNVASLEDVGRMLSHLEEALVGINFLDPLNPRKLMPRLRRLFSRSQLRNEEVNIMRGIARKILKKTKQKQHTDCSS